MTSNKMALAQDEVIEYFPKIIEYFLKAIIWFQNLYLQSQNSFSNLSITKQTIRWELHRITSMSFSMQVNLQAINCHRLRERAHHLHRRRAKLQILTRRVHLWLNKLQLIKSKSCYIKIKRRADCCKSAYQLLTRKRTRKDKSS